MLTSTALFTASVAVVAQDPGPGITQELAQIRQRQVSAPAYDLEFTLASDMTEARGTAVIRFTLGDDPTQDVVLDFDGTLGEVRINGVGASDEVRRVHDHLVLPARLLSKGENDVDVTFASAVAATGTPLTRYRETATGLDYLYTLLVPADAHRLFPCFDQPDLKARFSLRIVAPAGWQVVGNAPLLDRQANGAGAATWQFAPTTPICTYLFAFAAGPFEVLESTLPLRHGDDQKRPMRMYLRAEERGRIDAQKIFSMHATAVAWLATNFACPYPFAKLDFVLVPGFPYGGMEHAGAIFYRESALSFDHVPTAGELLARSALVYHEVSHQWFGNLVSFVWFDDLWLKEGFATFMGYRLIEELEPGSGAWVQFHRRVKPRAYAVDATPGTTPVYQALGNLADAKSAYGAIVYNKAPAVLRELEARMGSAPFRAGVARFLERHAGGNATWQDLMRALQEASGERLDRWSKAWIVAPGLPRVRAEWSVDADGKLLAFSVVQSAVSGGEARWPLRLGVLLASGAERRRADVVLEGERVEIEELVGAPAPDWVILNPTDEAYGQFLLDPRSATALLAALPAETDPMTRAVALTALRETMRAGELDPAKWVDLLLRLLATEREPEAHAWLLDAASQATLRYLTPARREPLRARLESTLLEQLRAPTPALALQCLRSLLRCVRSDAGMELISQAVRERSLPGDVELGPQDVYGAYAALLAAGRADGLREELPQQGDVAKFVYLAEAAQPDAATKARYFKTYLDSKEPPEQWVQQSLDSFHWPGQEELTLPFLRKALDQIEWVKANRKIFFMPAWIDGFVNGHSSPQALAVVEGFLRERADLSEDVRRKILQSLDELQRAVRIQAAWQ